ncbi:unnamed protein product [Adineta ricciae]|uniref:Uncharacterized protein n=1 Tax=Adineta ricciae TaxID=249248 RepID=A0A815ZCK8_ADIRI|nr:unnamed protein product [Adineta ricciae]CAF1580802.1 unnamed protein product [Adineta ricciae]
MHKNKNRQQCKQDSGSRNSSIPNREDDTYTSHKSPTTFEGCNYTVTLRVAPAEHGIKCYSSRWYTHQFTGINAFNHYFKYLLPNEDGFTLPDIWDGYFHITLAKFRLDRNNLPMAENNLVKRINEKFLHSGCAPFEGIFPCRFKSSTLDVQPGSKRYGKVKDVNFITLGVTDLENAFGKLRSYLDIIEEAIEQNDDACLYELSKDCIPEAHVTVRKYRQRNIPLGRLHYLKQLVKDNPIEFQCVALDITQTRRQACSRELQTNWWIGVTANFLKCTKCGTKFTDESKDTCMNVNCGAKEPMYECSGCGTRGDVGKSWPGYCRYCKKYERLRPLWSTKPEQGP